MTSPGKEREGCILHELAELLASDEALKAVWLDAHQKRVSCAFADGADTTDTRKRLGAIIARHRPEHLPDCVQDPWKVDCLLCELGRARPMPPGIRLLSMPDAGVLLEKDAAGSEHGLAWQKFDWMLFRPRGLEIPESEGQLEDWKHDLHLAAACGIFALAGILLEEYTDAPRWAILASYIAAYAAGGWHAVADVWELLKKRALDVHFLMLAVALGAAAIGHWSEGAILLFLFSFSGALEEMAMARTERAIRSLFHEAPKEATVLSEGRESRVPVEALREGDLLRVRPGDQFPVDAEITAGTTAVDESNLTGESIPVEKAVGDVVLGGTINSWGSIDCRVLRPAGESALARIIRLIQEAQRSKAPSQRFTDRFGTGYTWTVLAVTAVMFLVWWRVLGVSAFSDGAEPSAFYRAMTLLVVASPCALVLSIPSAILAGIAAGARRGVLFRGGAAIEKLAAVTRVAMDKTGTLTTGVLRVDSIVPDPPGHGREVLAIAGSLAHHSAHPVSRAVVAECRARGIELVEVTGFRSRTGLGLEASIPGPAPSSERPPTAGGEGGSRARLGRRALFDDASWARELPLPPSGATEVLVEHGSLRGRILLRDEIRSASAPLLAALERRGLALSMLTGDREESAHHVADALGLRDVNAGLSPDEKVARIRAWSDAGERVAMIGDGVNDAPSLAAAHVAVGMGMRGSDAALEQADVVLMQDRLENFLYAYHLSRRARRIIRQNLAISLGVILLLVGGALGSSLPLTLGVIGHEGSTVVVVLNSLRLLWDRKPAV